MIQLVPELWLTDVDGTCPHGIYPGRPYVASLISAIRHLVPHVGSAIAPNVDPGATA
jgi:hypothetical protein